MKEFAALPGIGNSAILAVSWHFFSGTWWPWQGIYKCRYLPTIMIKRLPCDFGVIQTADRTWFAICYLGCFLKLCTSAVMSLNWVEIVACFVGDVTASSLIKLTTLLLRFAHISCLPWSLTEPYPVISCLCLQLIFSDCFETLINICCKTNDSIFGKRVLPLRPSAMTENLQR